MSQWITDFVESVGYLGIAGLMFLEIWFPLIQSEIVMTFSGFSASRGDLNVIFVALAGIAGSQIGSLALYGAVRPVSEERINQFLARYGGWLGFDLDDLESAQEKFRKHDQWAVLIGRLLPGLRAFIAIPAGIQKMPVWEFFAFNLIGTAFWVSVLTTLGWVLGDNYDAVDQYSSYITYGLLALAAGYVLFRIGVVTYRKVTDRSTESAS